MAPLRRRSPPSGALAPRLGASGGVASAIRCGRPPARGAGPHARARVRHESEAPGGWPEGPGPTAGGRTDERPPRFGSGGVRRASAVFGRPGVRGNGRRRFRRSVRAGPSGDFAGVPGGVWRRGPRGTGCATGS